MEWNFYFVNTTVPNDWANSLQHLITPSLPSKKRNCCFVDWYVWWKHQPASYHCQSITSEQHSHVIMPFKKVFWYIERLLLSIIKLERLVYGRDIRGIIFNIGNSPQQLYGTSIAGNPHKHEERFLPLKTFCLWTCAEDWVGLLCLEEHSICP